MYNRRAVGYHYAERSFSAWLRIAQDYAYLQHLQPINVFISISAFVMGFSQLIFFANMFYSLFWGPKAERNPWHANTLVWTAPSPPGHGNFDIPPVVVRGPYEYSVPGMEADFLPQTAQTPAGVTVPAHAH